MPPAPFFRLPPSLFALRLGITNQGLHFAPGPKLRPEINKGQFGRKQKTGKRVENKETCEEGRHERRWTDFQPKIKLTWLACSKLWNGLSS